MDINLKQWRDESEVEEEQKIPSKQPRLVFSQQSSALPLFVTQPTTTNLSSYSTSTTSATKFPRMGSYFSLAQWQELELQALIFRHMIAGAAVPSELLHLVKKSLITSSPYYIHQYYSHCQPPLVQSGYWGKSAMDPEPGRCRRTDGKKWRCSRDVVAGQKYCERHMHRGKNRSRKPVEIPTSTTAASGGGAGGDGGGEAFKTNQYTTQGMGGGTLNLVFRGLPWIFFTSIEAQNDGRSDGGRTLRHFFDDWPRSLHETENAASSVTNLSISMPGNPSSDFSLKLGTGNGDELGGEVERERPQMNWGMTWETNRTAPMGGPLAEALRSSMTTSSPTSVLHRLTRSSASETSYVSS
ncbi:hypothetical protein DH2020_026262 [Rehmannia glutinosa]|uniref:Growth-regulating factor n=1 Tax=Rehmannia glutinosa TaxID=99300 RepID=A0ABR0VXE4_REHGL